jgi:hypothetical protein
MSGLIGPLAPARVGHLVTEVMESMMFKLLIAIFLLLIIWLSLPGEIKDESETSHSIDHSYKYDPAIKGGPTEAAVQE